jgi:hypothetical protein
LAIHLKILEGKMQLLPRAISALVFALVKEVEGTQALVYVIGTSVMKNKQLNIICNPCPFQ